MRLVAGVTLVDHEIKGLMSSPRVAPAILPGLAICAGILLLAGLWTPIVGALVVVLTLSTACWIPGDPWMYVLLGTLGVALALIGPGAWSVDARLFGWKRIDISRLAE
jgi:uncharacterized membrane protein YphA (DoxX/SURF4 family)